MSRFTRRTLAVAVVTTVAGSLALLAFTPSARTSAAPAPTPPHNVITIPGPDQVSNALDTSRCPRLNPYVAALTGGASGFQSADGSVASRFALLLAVPLTAAECAAAGN